MSARPPFPLLPLITVSAGAVMLLVDVTVVNVALPAAAGELTASFTDMQWVVDGYVLVLAAFLLGAGSMADRFGRRRGYVAGLGVFGAASLACGLAPNPELLIAARAVQGIAAAAMFAIGPALLGETYRGRSRAVAFGVWGGVSAAAAAAGPVVGGVLTHFLGWRWIFLVNVPVSVVAVLLALRVFPRSAGDRGRRFDLAGTMAFTLCAGALVYPLIKGNELGWASPAVLVSAGICVLAAVAFVLAERRSAAPVLDLALLRNRPFVGVSVAAVALTMSAYSYLLYLSLQLQSHDHFSAMRTGLVLAPLGFAAMVTALLVRGTLPPRVSISGGLLLVAIGALVLAAAPTGPPWPLVLAGTAVAGAGAGLVSPLLAVTAVDAVPADRSAMASAANAACRQLGTALGIALFGAVFPHHGLRALFVISTCTALAGAALAWPLLRAASRDSRGRTTPADRGGSRQRSRQ